MKNAIVLILLSFVSITAKEIVVDSIQSDTSFNVRLQEAVLPYKGVSVITSEIDDTIHLIEHIIVDVEPYGKYYKRFNTGKDPLVLIDSICPLNSELKIYSFSRSLNFKKYRFTSAQLKNRKLISTYRLGDTTPLDYNFIIVLSILSGFGLGFIAISISNFLSAKFSKKDLEEAEKELGDTPTTEELSKFYRGRINKYQDDTHRKGNWTFFSAMISMATGIGFLYWGGYKIFAQGEGVSIVGTVITTLGAAITTFIAKTFLDIHKQSTSELNHYYKHPVINDHVLMAQRLADEMPEDEYKRAEYQKIITSLTGLVDRMDNINQKKLEKETGK